MESNNLLQKKGNVFKRLFKPEFQALLALLVLWLFFSALAGNKGFFTLRGFKSILDVAADAGIISVVATLLLISGEFDLSVGSMVAFSGISLALLISEWKVDLWLSIIIVLCLALAYGFLQGFVVVKTKLPSLIVTLGGLFFLKGLAIGLSYTLAGKTMLGGLRKLVENSWLSKIFAGELFGWLNVTVIWWLIIAIIVGFIFHFTIYGNWILSIGGSKEASAALGVPVNRVRIILFMATSASAALLACMQVLALGSADVARGNLKELEVIITAVIGGTLISGGYGSPIGTFFGCLTIAVLKNGILFTGIQTSWYQAVLGLILIIAVSINRVGQKYAGGS